ncbi:hypothetical protein IZU99_08870 [Oscillospiraceae bacterium CM]|nr:hypothetical protein IZU99_08870 [Oscillospiraceae bacterium CM]
MGTPSPTDSCKFAVSQNICVQIPLTFKADVSAISAGIACGTPASGNCSTVTGCTYSFGYFSTHPALTNSLITAAGGSIILGIDNLGASFTVTTANSAAVLSLNTPSPPAPSLPPFARQYQNLYAQLLASNLNVINGATCDNVSIAISNANTFIATSPSGVGKAGAPLVAAPLAAFNLGNLSGCPEHCP